MKKPSPRQEYTKMHEHRMFLFFGGFLSEKENASVKKKLDSFARKNKIETMAEEIARLSLNKNPQPIKEGD